jgi:hypothetical protein
MYKTVVKHVNELRTWMDSVDKRPKRREMYRSTSLGSWNVRSLYRAGSVMAVSRELTKCKLDLLGVGSV